MSCPHTVWGANYDMPFGDMPHGLCAHCSVTQTWYRCQACKLFLCSACMLYRTPRDWDHVIERIGPSQAELYVASTWARNTHN